MKPVAGNDLVETGTTRHDLVGGRQSRRDRRERREQQLHVIDQVRCVLFVGDLPLQGNAGRGDLGVEACTEELDVLGVGDEVPRGGGIGVGGGGLPCLRSGSIHLRADTRRYSEGLIDDPSGSRSCRGCGNGTLKGAGACIDRRQPAVEVREEEAELGVPETGEPAQGGAPLTAVGGIDIRCPRNSEERSIQRRLDEERGFTRVRCIAERQEYMRSAPAGKIVGGEIGPGRVDDGFIPGVLVEALQRKGSAKDRPSPRPGLPAERPRAARHRAPLGPPHPPG